MPRPPEKIIALWGENILKTKKISANELARLSKLGPATVHRLLGRDEKYSDTPSMKTVFKIAQALNVPMPDFSKDGAADSAEFLEPDITEAPAGTTTKLAMNETEWIVETRNLLLAGYLPGDRLIADSAITPRDGDVVIAEIYDFQSNASRNVLRVYRNHQLVTASPNIDEYVCDDTKDRAVKVSHVVRRSWRERMPSTDSVVSISGSPRLV